MKTNWREGIAKFLQGMVLFILFSGVVGPYIYVYAAQYNRKVQFKARGRLVEAYIYDLEPDSYFGGTYFYEFKVNGKVFKGKSRPYFSSKGCRSINENVTIVYLPEDPQINDLAIDNLDRKFDGCPDRLL